MTEADERELWEMFCAAFTAKGTDAFRDHVRAIEERWLPAYEHWLIRNRDRAKPKARAA